MTQKKSPRPVVLRYNHQLLEEAYDIHLQDEFFFFARLLVPLALTSASDCIILAEDEEQAKKSLVFCAEGGGQRYLVDVSNLEVAPLTRKEAEGRLHSLERACIIYRLPRMGFGDRVTAFCKPVVHTHRLDLDAAITHHAFAELLLKGVLNTRKPQHQDRQITLEQCVKRGGGRVSELDGRRVTVFDVPHP